MPELLLVFQRHISHTLRLFLFGKKGTNNGEAESAEKQQQRDNSEPLNALYGLQNVFVHDVKLLKGYD